MEGNRFNGYSGKILRVDLTQCCWRVEKPTEQFYQEYLGGRGIIIHTLLRELPPGTDPLGPANLLIFALGPLQGIPLSGCSRNSVGAKSPLTQGYGEAEAGGFWGAELKRAGYDAIIIEGAAASPVYLRIQNGEVELRDARRLWGLEVSPTEKAIRSELGDERIRTAVIGPAGEKLVRFACIMNDVTHAAGRQGLGAVMGSKKLKAIAVKGNHPPIMADRQAVLDLSRWLAQNYKTKTGLWKAGTGSDVVGYNLAGNLPTRNFRDGFFDHAEAIAAVPILDKFGVRMESCYACVIRCKKVVQIEEPWKVDPVYGGPEYETIAAFGSNCLVGDPKVVCKAHELCNRLGMDTISTGATIAFAMECFEKGILTRADTDGLDVSFGNGPAMIEAIELIAQRLKFGDILAEGSRRAALRIGKGAEALAIEVKGLELPMHEPRLKKAMGLHYSVHAGGADHCTGIHDTMFAAEGNEVSNWRLINSSAGAVPAHDLSPRKVRLLYDAGRWRHLANMLLLCTFIPFNYTQIRELVSAVTGWPVTFEGLREIVDRSLTLMRIFNLREGFSTGDDRLPERFGSPQEKGGLKEVIPPSALNDALKQYYQLLGWDENGIPTRETIRRLGIEWAQRYLK